MGYVDYVGGNDVDSKKYKKIVPVFLTVSNEYFKYFGVLLQSIINHANTACFFDVIVIIDEEISDDNFGKLEIILSGIDNFRVRFFDINELVEGWKPYLRASYKINSYYRLLAPYFILEYKKAIYLDVDMIVREDISKLFDVDIKGAYLGATKDVAGQGYYKLGVRKDLVHDFTNIIGLDDVSNYFQAAVLIVNLEKFRKNFSMDRIKEICAEKPWMFIDQDVYNYIVGKEVFFLDLKWNVTAKTVVGEGLENAPEELSELYTEARKNPYIIHYPGEKKPWLFLKSDFAYYFWQEARRSVFYEEVLEERHRVKHVQAGAKQKELVKLSKPIKESNLGSGVRGAGNIAGINGQLLFRCATFFHLFNAINIKIQLYPMHQAHIILTGDINWGDIPQKLRISGIFSSVFASKTKKQSDFFDSMTKEVRYSSVIHPGDSFTKTGGDPGELDYITSIGNITDYFVAMSNFHEKYLYYYIKENFLGNTQVHIFEEGSASYVLNYETGNLFDCLDHKFYKQKSYPDNICEVMVYAPELVVQSPKRFKYNSIPKIDKSDKVLRKHLIQVFGDVTVPKEKYIYFDSPDIAENYLSNGIDVLDKFSEIVGKDNIIVKIHPRNSQDKYSIRGYKIMTQDIKLWEMCCFNQEVIGKVFLSEFSTASMTANTIFQTPIVSVNFFKLLLQPKKNFLFSKQGFESFYESYCNYENKEKMVVFTPENMDELTSVAYYLKGLR